MSPEGGTSWLLLNASPDLREQILATPWLHPRGGSRSTPIAGVLLTNGDVDHIAGLLTLRERQPFTLFASTAILDMIARDAVFDVLDRDLVERRAVEAGQTFTPVEGLTAELFPVPGKVPLFLEAGPVEIGTETEMTVGVELTSRGRRLVYVPGCAAVTPGLLARISGADVLMFDGTTFTDNEMVELGLSHKTAARMGHLAMSGPHGSIAALSRANVKRKVYTHINNTNPVLVAGSPERIAVEAGGWEIASDGMEIEL